MLWYSNGTDNDSFMLCSFQRLQFALNFFSTLGDLVTEGENNNNTIIYKAP